MREKEYFELLGEKSSRIRIKVLSQDAQHRSAPKWVLDSAATYSSDVGLIEEDQMWLVLDTDRWPDDQLREINDACNANRNWFLALSNPCFEVWLYIHLDEIETSASQSCAELKTELGQKVKGGYNKVSFIGNIRQAHDRAKKSDNQPSHFMPSKMRTKLYKLTGAIFNLVGLNSDL